jgi:hypothetical protein
VLQRFRYDDSASVIGVLNDLVDAGIISCTGRGAFARYRMADVRDVIESGPDAEESLASFVWVMIFRQGPLTRRQLAEGTPALPTPDLDRALVRLEETGRVQRVLEHSDETFSSTHCVIPLDASVGWEAAVFDHFQAMANAIAAKIRGDTNARASMTSSAAARFTSTSMRTILCGTMYSISSSVSGVTARSSASVSKPTTRLPSTRRGHR